MMDARGGSRHAGAPRTLDVQKFGDARRTEVHALHAVLKEKKGRDGTEGVVAIPRCLRRRTTSHIRRKAFFWQRKQKKRKYGDVDEAVGGESERVETEGGDAVGSVKKPPCRRVRRRIELKGDENGGGGCARDGTQRLVTHVWHAKRFTMTKIWGHWLAEGLPGRGRGSRAVIRWVREAAVLQDASFYSAIELAGNEGSIAEALQLVLKPVPKSAVNGEYVLRGTEYTKAMLHHLDKCPRGAIAPVTYLWRPESKAGEDAERRIWIWVHAAAFEEALACLQHLCRTQGLQCWSRKGQLGRLDLLGSKASSILQKVLHPVARQASQEGCVEAVPPSSCDSSSVIASLEDSHQFPGGAVIGMEVWDPRGSSHSDMTFQPSVLVNADSDRMEVDNMDFAVSNPACPSTDNRVDVNSSIASPIMQRNTIDMSEKTKWQIVGIQDMWDRLDTIGQGSIVKPYSEKDLSTRRHMERLSYIQLNDYSKDTKEESNAASESVKCPILILKHTHRRPSACGFSLILPVAWVRAFWVPLVFAGGRVIGLRERHWLHTDAQLPSFPHDYPDCFSYDQHMARKAAEDQETYNRRPPSKRGIWKSGLPDWNFVNEASALYAKNGSTAQGVSTAEFGAEAFCSAVCENSETISNMTSNDSITCPSSTDPEAPFTQLNFSTDYHVLTTASGTGISAATVAEISMIDSCEPSNDALVLPSLCNLPLAELIPSNAGDDCTSALIIPAPTEVLDASLILDHTVGLRSPQPDPIFDSQLLASATEGQNKERDSVTADMEASTSALNVPPLLEVSGQIENPSTLEDESVWAAVGKHEASEGGDNGKSSIFVARSWDTLEKVLRDCNLHHLPFLTWFRTSTELPNLPIQLIPNFPGQPILPDHSTWQLVGDGSTELAKKGCLVRVMIHAPRKGILDSGAIIYLPLPSDIDSYSSSSQRWQGFDDPSFKQVQQLFVNKKKRKQKIKGVRKIVSVLQGSTLPHNTACPADLSEPRSESCSLRLPIGIVTSGSVRGSKSSAAIGICEVAALGVLRAKQMAPDQRYPSPEILVLARNASSSMYRPALASIVAENEYIDV